MTDVEGTPTPEESGIVECDGCGTQFHVNDADGGYACPKCGCTNWSQPRNPPRKDAERDPRSSE